MIVNWSYYHYKEIIDLKEKDSEKDATTNMTNKYDSMKRFISNFRKQGNKIIDTTTITSLKAEMVKNNIHPTIENKVAKDFDGSPVPHSEPPPHKLPNGYIKDPFTKRVIEKAKEIEKSREVQPTRAPSKIELDQEAIQSQVNYRQHKTKDGNQWSIYNHKLVYPTGCEDKCLRNMIARENKKRIENNEKPFLTYDEFADNEKVKDDPFIRGYKIVSHKKDNPVSKAIPQYLVAQKYYLLRDGNTTFIFDNNDNRGASSKRCLRLQKHTNSDESAGGSRNSISTINKSNPLVDISQDEHNNILSSKPSLDNLLNAYILVDNTRPKFMDENDISNLGTQMNFSLTQNIF